MNAVKLLVTILILLVSMPETNAQQKFFVGGGFNYSAEFFDFQNSSRASYSFSPTIGMKVKDNWQVGLSFGYAGFENTYNDSTFVERGESFVRPFARYRQEIAEGFGLYGEFGMRFGIGSEIQNDGEADFTVFRVYLGPGIDYALTERWILLASLGVARYYNYSSDLPQLDNSSISLGLDMSRVEFGLNYFF